MSEETKSLIRHILTALGFVLGLIGLNKFTNIITYITDNLDALWSAITAIAGIVIGVIGFFRDKARFAIRGK